MHFVGRWLRGRGASHHSLLHEERRAELMKVSQEGSRVFTLSVALKFRDEQAKSDFLSLLSTYSPYVEEHEPTTLTYQMMQSDKDSLEMLLLERYVNKNAYLNVHRKSPEFVRYREKVTALSGVDGGGAPGLVMQGSSYDDIEIGFFDL
jgi:quinol monooxygenase YgiN